MNQEEFEATIILLQQYLNEGDVESAADLFFDLREHMDNGGHWYKRTD